MPTALPIRAQHIRRLSRLDFVRVVFLAARIRLLDAWINVVTRQGVDLSDDQLLRLMARWLALHEKVGALLPDTPEPEHVRQVRAILRPSARKE